MAEPGAARQVPWRADGAILSLLPVAGIFGANASGKSSMLRATADIDVTDAEVVAEYAYRFPKGRQSLVFERDGGSFQFGPSLRSVGKMLEKVTRRNSLLLSVAGAVGQEDLDPLFRWFGTNLRLAEADSRGIRAARRAPRPRQEV